MHALLSRLRGDEDSVECRCRPDFEGDRLVVNANDCPDAGRLESSAECRETVVGALAEWDVMAVTTRANGVVRAYEGDAAAFLVAAGRFADAARFHDERLAELATRDPLAAAREATGRAGPVSRIAAETGLADGAAQARAYEDALRPFVGPTVSRSRVAARPPANAELVSRRELDTGGVARVYDRPDDAVRERGDPWAGVEWHGRALARRNDQRLRRPLRGPGVSRVASRGGYQRDDRLRVRRPYPRRLGVRADRWRETRPPGAARGSAPLGVQVRDDRYGRGRRFQCGQWPSVTPPSGYHRLETYVRTVRLRHERRAVWYHNGSINATTRTSTETRRVTVAVVGDHAVTPYAPDNPIRRFTNATVRSVGRTSPTCPSASGRGSRSRAVRTHWLDGLPAAH